MQIHIVEDAAAGGVVVADEIQRVLERTGDRGPVLGLATARAQGYTEPHHQSSPRPQQFPSAEVDISACRAVVETVDHHR